MNIIRMTGGLGNQMFQYALYLEYKHLGIDACFEDWSEYDNRKNARPISLEVFNIDYPRADINKYNEYTDSGMDFKSRVRRKLLGRKSREYSEQTANFDADLLEVDNRYVTGYFQSERYFENIKSEVLKAFDFNEKVKNRGRLILKESLSFYENDDNLKETYVIQSGFGDDDKELLLKSNTVSIHIRRGDYLEASKVYGGICTEEYYERCIAFFLEKIPDAVFLVFSNDEVWAHQWCSAYQKRGINMILVRGVEEHNGYIDMYLMSLCHHHIIANSSFSWWGAYLGQKYYDKDDCGLVVAPSRWVNTFDQQDIYTGDMIRI